MGGCVISIMSTANSAKKVQNHEIMKIREMPTQSVEIGDNEGRPESRIRRSPSMADCTLEQMNAEYYGGEHGTLLPMLKETIGKYSGKNAMAYRPIDHIEKTEIEEGGKKKQWVYTHLKKTEYITYSQMWAKIIAFGNGLVNLIGSANGTRIGIYEETCPEWMISLYGLWSQGFVGVTVYSNLGEDALEYAIKESELKVILCHASSIKNLRKSQEKGEFTLDRIIYLGDLEDAEKQGMGNTILTKFEDVLREGEGGSEPEFPKDPNELALIMYTSGTTGDPKGVMYSHGNCVACVKGFSKRLSVFMSSDPNVPDTYVCYLPLAHCLEFAAENVLLMRGSMLGYGTPRTLTDTTAKPHGDFKEFNPTFVVGVPRIFDTLRKAVESKLPPPGSLQRRVFDRAYEERKAALDAGMDTPYWNAKVFAKPRSILGNRCVYIVSGGAPLSAKTHEFLSVVFGCSAGQGYGLTETCATCTMQRYYDMQKESIGGLLPNVEVKLRDVGEDFTHTMDPPKGELCIRGPVVTKGYFKQPEKTAEAFGADGWFYTGDVGQFSPDGTIKIVGRTKALAKNVFGEYIALEALEITYILNDLVLPNGVCVLVDSQKAYVCALVLTDEAKATKFAKENNIAGNWPDFLQNPEFHKKAALSLAATAKGAGKKPFECVKYVRVLNDEWTPENGVLTAAMKLKRRVIDEKYKDLIKELFAQE